MSSHRNLFNRFVQISCLLLFPVTIWSGLARADTASVSWFDKANNEEGFKLERKLGTTGSFAQIATLGANMTSYIDSGLTNETNYCYRVRAFNALMDSPYSAETCFTMGQASLFKLTASASAVDSPASPSASVVHLQAADQTRAETDGRGTSKSAKSGQPAASSESTSHPFPLETAEIQVYHRWTRVKFKETFLDPVVVATPLSAADQTPAAVRIRNVNPLGFEIRSQELVDQDEPYLPRTVGYIVMEHGSYTLADGSLVEAGKFETDQLSFGVVAFSQPFSTVPVVVTAISSFNDAAPVTGQIRNVNDNTFGFRLHERENAAQTHEIETISFIAWEPSAGTLNGMTFEVDTAPQSVSTHWYMLPFVEALGNSPVFLADIQTDYNGYPDTLRWRDKDDSGVEIRINEEQSFHRETEAPLEVVGYLVFTAIK